MTDQPTPCICTDIIATEREWRDISFAPLPPGWVNVYEHPNGRVSALPCPGTLTQELEWKCTYYLDGSRRQSVRGDPDFNPETRIVFAVARRLRRQPPNYRSLIPNYPTLIPADDGGDADDIYIATVTAEDAEANWGAL